MSLLNFGFSKGKSTNFETGNIDNGGANIDAETDHPESPRPTAKRARVHHDPEYEGLCCKVLLFIIIKFASICLNNHESSIDAVY